MPEISELGAYLKDCRESLKLERAQVAETLRIRPLYLEALEQGHFSVLPGKAYARGYLQRYAELLGVSVPDVLARYDEMTGLRSTKSPPLEPSRRPPAVATIPLPAIALVLFALAAIVWIRADRGPAPQTVGEVPAQYRPLLAGFADAILPADTPESCFTPMRRDLSPLCATSAMPAEAISSLFRPKQGFSSELIFAIE